LQDFFISFIEMKKKVFKILAWGFATLTLIILCSYAYMNYLTKYKFIPKENEFTKRVAYIDPEKALLSEDFETCSDYIFDYYNPERATYSKEKNGLRKFILTHYKNKNYNDSGYLNIRFVINCNGETGRYIIHENDLDLEPKPFNKDLVNQLFDLTVQLKEWNPNVIRGKKRDSYMYISYRIENGEITQIIP